MRITKIELHWFRGASESGALETDRKSVVVYGPNAAGKSSFADGLEYIVRSGKIKHLQHEYSGTYHEKGVRNTAAPQDENSRIWVHFDDGSCVETDIRPAGTFTISSNPNELKQLVQNWSVESHLLRQDEVAHFINYTKGEKYSALLPLLGLDALERAAENLHQIRLSIIEKSKLEINVEMASRLAKEAKEGLQSLGEKDVLLELNKLVKKYAVQKQATDIGPITKQLIAAIKSKMTSLEPEQSRYVMFKQILNHDLTTKLEEMISEDENARAKADAYIDLRIPVLEKTEKFLAIIEDPEKEVECPSCGRKILGNELIQYVRKELESLKEIRSTLNHAKSKREAMNLAFGDTLKKLQDPNLNEWSRLPEQKEFGLMVNELQEIKIPDSSVPWEIKSITTTKGILSKFLPIIEERTTVATPSTKELVDDLEYIKQCSKIPEIQALKKDSDLVQSLVTLLGSCEEAVRKEISEKAQRIFDDISEDISYLWTKLHPHEPIEDIELYTLKGSEKAIDVKLRFFGTDQPSPRLTLSEGYRNSLGLCIFLALARLEGRDEPIILDDIVSSLDREHRGMLTNLLLEDLAGRQIILLTHDRDWYAELHCRLPQAKWKFMVLRPWENPKVGLTWSGSIYTFDDAKKLLTESPEACANRVRAIMDTNLAVAAERLRIPMEYLRGESNDHRTCVNFLDRIIGEAPKRFKKKINGSWAAYDEPVSHWKEVRGLIVAWADPASHSGAIEKKEAEQLMSKCETALVRFRCESCGDYVWVADQTKRQRVQCSCGKLRWDYV